ncbi:DUF4259 domain-containing protein [Taylorella equigenitalis]|uniref:DUF4259 domain-containing protein n=3 Tax=Taylorella equigenitalis TaxID=29575 RepID=A0A654KJ64_TAYEM|nr:DUF4259 domain-containing protein [Taylorella equigenitalis]ADU92507.1 hypothetical protein TEQUI_1595 [Taylorella equigenitalis MCE9]AFN36055.1 hypothetical protein KUI_0983 [Taylorella equigenitalis ATCC 35865]ASY37992.1 DUF4259 domain-containing protein [Taylorella equigenitalis]ASY39469.1 hypothetical protein CA604_04945 [Taylorella equigenitalis]ASY40980.1 hypothetical protein CAV20_04730 [Taylorella equigenitalis]
MGAWGVGIFEDDMAYEFSNQIEENAIQFFKTSFEDAIETDYLEKDEAYAVLISAAYLDNYFYGTQYENDFDEEDGLSNVNNFQELYVGTSLEELKPYAEKALGVVLGDNSELNELWQESEEDYPLWKENIISLKNRLKI